MALIDLIDRESEGRNGALKVLVLSGDETQRREITQALSRLGDPPLEIAEASLDDASDAGAGAADVSVVVLDGTPELSLRYVKSQSQRSPRPALFAVIHERSPDLVRRVLRAGADELLFMPLDSTDAMRAFIKAAEIRRRMARGVGGTCCSVTSLAGGTGVTTVSLNLALALHYALDKRVALVDLDLQKGGLSALLGLTPDRTIAILCQSEKKLDSIHVESALTKVNNDVYLLAAPKRLEDSETISQATVAAVLELMREMFDLVVIDTGSHIDDTVVTAWEQSDRLLYLLDQSIPGAGLAWRFLDLLGRLKLEAVEPSFVINRFADGRPVTEKQLAQSLGREIYAKILRDDKVLELAQLQAQHLWKLAPRCPLARSMENLAEKVVARQGEEPPPRSNGLLSRLIGAIGMRAQGADDVSR